MTTHVYMCVHVEKCRWTSTFKIIVTCKVNSDRVVTRGLYGLQVLNPWIQPA
jgi:hypothetical protein